METDRNLLIGVLALQAGLIDSKQFIEICTLWTTRKEVPLTDLLIERGWILASDVAPIEYLLRRNLEQHGGDAAATLVAVDDDVALRKRRAPKVIIERYLSFLGQGEDLTRARQALESKRGPWQVELFGAKKRSAH